MESQVFRFTSILLQSPGRQDTAFRGILVVKQSLFLHLNTYVFKFNIKYFCFEKKTKNLLFIKNCSFTLVYFLCATFWNLWPENDYIP